MPPGLAELEQLHVKSNSEQLMSLHRVPQLHMLQATKIWVGPGNEAGYKQGKPSRLALLEQVHVLYVKSDNECSWHLRSTLSNSLSIHWQECGQATPMHSVCKA